MNKIYKVVWNAARGCYVVASEFASAKDGYAAMSAKTVREVIHKIAQGAVVALAGFVILSSGGLVYAAEPAAANAVKHQYVVFAAIDEVNNAPNISTAKGAYFTNNDQVLYTSTGRLYTGTGTPYVRTNNNNYVRYTGNAVEGQDIYKYNRVQLTDVDGNQKYYMVRDGYQAEINSGKRHSLASNSNLVDVVWTGNGTPPSDLLTSVASTNSFTGTQTNLGKELEQVHATMYAGASNSGGTVADGTWNYIITEDNGHKDTVGGTGGLPKQFMTTSNSNNRLQWDENLQSYKYDGQIVPQQNVYVIGNSVGVFTKQDGSLYTGDVYGINNELLRTTVKDGQYYSYWAADVTDPTLTMMDYPVVEYNEDLKALENNDEKLAQNDINHIKVAKTSVDGAANTTASIAAYRNGDDMKGTENDTNLVSGQVNLKESGGTGGIADNGVNDRKMSVSVTNRTVAADGTVSTSETPVADFSLGSRVGDSSDVTEDGKNLKQLTINGQSYGMKTFLKGNNADEATVEANLGDTIYVQGSDTNAKDQAGNNNIVVTAEDSTAGKKLNVALNEHVKINELTAGVSNGETNSTAGKINIVRQDGATQTITAVENNGDSVTKDRLQYTGADNTAHVLATTDDGMKFKGDDATVLTKKMNDQLNITGGADSNNLSDGNIGVTSDNGNLKVQLAKDVKDLNTVTAGTAVLGKDADGNSYVKGLDNKTWTIGETQPVSGRAATEDQLKVVSDGVNTNTQNINNITNTVNSGWNAKVGDTSINVKPDNNTLTFTAGDNIALAANAANSSITVGTTPVAGFTTVHVGGSGTGSTMTGGITLGNQAVSNTKNSNETGLYITGLQNKTWTAGEYVDGRAATENQLQQLQEQINNTTTIATAAGDTYFSGGKVANENAASGTYDIATERAETTRNEDGTMGDPKTSTGPTITGLHDYYVTSGSVNKENGHLTLTRQNGTVDIDLSDVLGSDSDWHVKDGSYEADANGDVTLTLYNDADATATDKQVKITGLQSKANANLLFAADTGTAHKVDAGGTQKIAGDAKNIHTSVAENGDIVVSLDANPSVESVTINNNKITSNGDTLQYVTNNNETKTIATTDDGLTFSGNTGVKVTRNLGTELAVKGNSANENIRVTGTNDGLVIGLGQDVKVNTLTAGSLSGTDGLRNANGTISIVGNAKEGNKEYINVQAGYREAEKPADPAKEGGDTDGITRLTYQGDKVASTGEVLGTPHVVATLEDGYKLSGDVTKNGTADATSVGLGLNKEISLKGGATADKLVADNYNNVGVTVTKDGNVGKINFQLNKDLDGLNTVTTRSANGVQGATLGNQTVASKSGQSETGSYVTKLSNTNWYTNPDTGAGGSLNDNSIVSGRAATEDQLQSVQKTLTDAIDTIDGKETNLSVNNEKATENSGKYVGKNLQLKYDTDKDGHIQNYDLKLADDLDVNSVTTGNTKMNTDGITITNTADNTKNVTLTSSGLNNGGNKVTNVAKGDVSETSTDAINGSQLYTVQQNVNNGWTAKVGNDSIKVTPTNNTLTFTAGDNIALSAKDSAITVATTPKAGFTELHVAGTGTGNDAKDGITLGTQNNMARSFNKSYTETQYDTDGAGNQTGGYTVITYTQQDGADADKTVTYKGTAQHYAINGDKDDKLPSQYNNIKDVEVNKTEEGSGKYITGLDNTGWNEHSYVHGRAATEDQLNDVAEQIRGQVSAADRYITKGVVVENEDTKKTGTYQLSFETSTNGPVDVENLHDYYVTGLKLDKETGKLTLNQHDGVGNDLKELSVNMNDLQTSFDADSNTEHENKANTPGVGGTQKILGDTKNINTKVDKDGNIVVALASDPTVNSITIGDTKITNNKEGDHLTYETKNGDTVVTNTIATLGDGYKLAGDVTRDGANAVKDPVGIDLGKAISLKGGATPDKLVADDYKNVGVTVQKNADGSADVNFQLNKDLDGLNSVTMRNGNKSTVLGYQTASYADGQKETGSYLTGLENKTWNPRQIVSGRAATEDQLQKVQDSIADTADTVIKNLNAKRTEVTVNGGTAAKADGTYNTEGNLQLKKTTDENTGKDTYDVKLADKLDLGDNGSVKTGNTTINNEGVTINNKKYITDNGVNANDQKITNVADGDVKEGSKDAVNGGQLYNVEQKVDQNTQNINNIQGDVNNIKNDVKNVQELAGKHTTLTSNDGSVKITDANAGKAGEKPAYDLSVDYGKIADHVADNVKLSYKANGENPQQVSLKDGLNFTNGNGTVASVDKDGVVKYDLADDINVDKITIGQPGKDGKDGKDGSIGLVGKDGKDGTTTTIIKTVGKNGTDGTNGTPGVDGKDGITRIVYQDGKDGTDHTVATLDDGLKFAGDDKNAIAKKLNQQLDIIGGADSKNLSDNNIGVNSTKDGQLKIQLAKDVTGMSSTTYTTKDGTTVVNGGGITIQKGGDTKNNITIKQGDVNMGGNQIHNIAPGEAPNDAATVGQLNDSITNVGHSLSKMNNRIDRVGAGAAALAGLHPQDFDPEDKWDFAAGYGHYRSANAMAVGAFYRPDEYTMFNVGGSFGGGENLLNAGLTIKLGKRDKDGLKLSRVAMAEQIRDLKATISMQEAKIQESDAREAEQNQRIAQLEAMVKALAAKQG